MRELIKKTASSLFFGKRVLAGAAVLIAIGYVAITHLLAIVQYVDDEIDGEAGGEETGLEDEE